MVLTHDTTRASQGLGVRSPTDPCIDWLRERCQLKTPRDHRPAKHFENDCQFGLVSAERMPKREGMPVIKQFRGERYCFQAPKPLQPFHMTVLFAYVHALIKMHACMHMCTLLSKLRTVYNNDACCQCCLLCVLCSQPTPL